MASHASSSECGEVVSSRLELSSLEQEEDVRWWSFKDEDFQVRNRKAGEQRLVWLVKH